jgi:hypothetical protein
MDFRRVLQSGQRAHCVLVSLIRSRSSSASFESLKVPIDFGSFLDFSENLISFFISKAALFRFD